jgi:hypothetical protein
MIPKMTIGAVLDHKMKLTDKPEPKAKYWMGTVPSVDNFGQPITDVFYDSKTVMGWPRNHGHSTGSVNSESATVKSIDVR